MKTGAGTALRKALIVVVIVAAIGGIALYLQHPASYLEALLFCLAIGVVIGGLFFIVSIASEIKDIIITVVMAAGIVALLGLVLHWTQPNLSWDDYLKFLGVCATASVALGAAVLSAVVSRGNIKFQRDAQIEQERNKDLLARQTAAQTRKREAFDRLDTLATKCYGMLHKLQSTNHIYEPDEVQAVLKEMDEVIELGIIDWPEYANAWRLFRQHAIYVHGEAVALLKITHRKSRAASPDWHTFYGRPNIGRKLGELRLKLQELAEEFRSRPT